MSAQTAASTPRRPSIAPRATSSASSGTSRNMSSASLASSALSSRSRLRLLTLPDGRSLAYEYHGSTDSAASTIVYFAGMWQCRVAGAYFKDVPRRMNIRLLCFDRCGVGQSTPTNDPAGCTFTTVAADVAYLINYLKKQESGRYDRFYFLSYSGGAAFALAAAQYFAYNKSAPSGLAGLAIMAGLPPTQLAKATMPLLARAATTVLTNFPRLIINFITADQQKAEHHDGVKTFSDNAAAAISQANNVNKPVAPNRIEKLVAAGGSSAKQSFFSKASNKAILQNVRKEVVPTAKGMLWDAYRILSTWPIPPENLAVGNIPIYMWYTNTDEVIPMQTAQTFASQLRQARKDAPQLGRDRRIFLQELPDSDHFSILKHSKRIFSDLVNS